jgi:hypothetical protein
MFHQLIAVALVRQAASFFKGRQCPSHGEDIGRLVGLHPSPEKIADGILDGDGDHFLDLVDRRVNKKGPL